MRHTILFLAGFLFASSAPAIAAASPTLYQGYEFGMSRAEVMKYPGVYDCSEEFEKGALCLQDQKFIDEDVDMGFRFIDNKLITVILFSVYTEENYMQFMGALNSKFQMVTMESGDKKFDFIIQLKKYERSQFMKNITDFEQQALASGNIKYTFIEKESFNTLIASSDNAVEMMIKADPDMRAVEYAVSEIDEATIVGLIQFSTPKQSMQLMHKKSKQKYEFF